jgi:hypothetical protein
MVGRAKEIANHIPFVFPYISADVWARVFDSRYRLISGFLPQGKLIKWVRINIVKKVITIVVKINSLSQVSNISTRNTWCNRGHWKTPIGSELNNNVIQGRIFIFFNGGVEKLLVGCKRHHWASFDRG